MAAKLIKKRDGRVVIEVDISLSKSMLDCESSIQDSLNEAGLIATREALQQFDTNGDPIIVGNQKYYAKEYSPNVYQCPYGPVKIERYIYQTSKGGKSYCPMDEKARIILKATPRFAKILSFKYAELGGRKVADDIKHTLNRSISLDTVQKICDCVGAFINVKEENWHYSLPELDEGVKTVAVGLDGTTVRVIEEGYREAMVGTLSLYNRKGERLHTVYVGAAPEYGKEKFLEKMTCEIGNLKHTFPFAHYIGIADGAHCNWEYLEKHTHTQVLDFYHASEYVTKAADVMFENLEERSQWLEDQCHKLKHNKTGASSFLKLIKKTRDAEKNKGKIDVLKSVETYFQNHHKRMNYGCHTEAGHPIGSGVTEAAAKTVIKARFCQSGMKWKSEGITLLMGLRTLKLTQERWEQAWKKIDRYGYNHAA